MMRKRIINGFLIAIIVIVVLLEIFFIKRIGSNLNLSSPLKSKISVDYDTEWDSLSEEDSKIIKEVISLAKSKIGMEYVWGGKGEIMTEDRLDELIGYYGQGYYPLDKNDYIGNQAFDCSGLTYWVYNKATGANIGYSTTSQRETMDKYKVEGNIQPGDLIYTTRHVVLYIGDGKVIDSKNKYAYPTGGVQEEPLSRYAYGDAYRPIDFINDIK